ncbi:MAG: AI-2E family transporter [Sporomusaceae bacterium]|nr:AI-2E family transporter [Sporomusaceae bacterium]
MSVSRLDLVRSLFLFVLLYVFYEASDVLWPLLLAFVFSFILNPLVNFLCHKVFFERFLLPRAVAVVIVMIAAFTLVGGVMSVIFLPFVDEFNKFMVNLPTIVDKFHILSLAIGEKANTIELPSNIRSILDQGMSSVTSFSIDFVKRMAMAFFSVASRAIALVVTPVLIYYFLKDGQKMKEDFIQFFSLSHQAKTRAILEEMALTMSAYLRGQLLISLIMGLMVFCGLFFLKVDYPMVIALLAFLTETVPIIGPILGAIPALALAYLTAPELAAKVLVFYIIVHQIDNHIIVPNIMGHTIALHPVIVIMSVIIGGQMFGIVGMMLAVPVAALLRVFIKHLHIVG